MATTPKAGLVGEQWLVPGSQTLYVLMPELYLAYELGELSESETFAAIERQLLAIVTGAMTDLGVGDRSLADDLVQSLHERVATMGAGARFDPLRTTPVPYLYGIARMLIREHLWRRERPRTVPHEVMGRVPTGTSQLDRAVRKELLEELRYWLDQLSPGEIRALVSEFGPLFDYSPPKGRRRRLRNPDALPRALEILRELAAHQIEQ
ncbi:MAG: sigma-70 family RNA polymerase sigma factor [Phycisphaerales bacterium]|nr:sigma-70 family RNA polymerase sigma factor [Phycisphaerales bacterium]